LLSFCEQQIQFRSEGEELLGRGDDALAAVVERVKVVTDAEAHQVIADELGGGEAAAEVVIEQPGPGHELGGDFARVGVAVGFPLGEEVPEGDEEFAGDGDDGLLLADAEGELVKNTLPIDRIADGGPGGFDESGAEVAAALFGDAAAFESFAGVMDSAAEAGIADELFVLGEAVDDADGAENGHGVDEAKAGQLDDKGDHIGPGFGDAEAGQFGFGLVDERGEGVEDGEVVAGAEFFGGRDGELVPPFSIGIREGQAIGRENAVAVEEGVEAVLGGGALRDETAPVSDEGAEFAGGVRGDPDLGDHVGGEEFGQSESVFFIGLDGSGGDELDVIGVGDGDTGDEGFDDVVDEPGIGGGFQDEGVGGLEVLGGPFGEARDRDSPGMEDGFFEGVDGSGDDIVLVDIESDEAVNFFRHSDTPFERLGTSEPGGAVGRIIAGQRTLHTPIRA